tara:strand:+ start:125 stop:463 length:339 start_codon:yes stop_codon:yes gene_type:complete
MALPELTPGSVQLGGKKNRTVKRHKRPVRGNDGKFHIKGKKYAELFGSRQKVWNGTAYKTTGNLVKTDLVQNSRRRIVSKKKYYQGKKERKTKSRLFKKYTAKKGQFGPVKR